MYFMNLKTSIKHFGEVSLQKRRHRIGRQKEIRKFEDPRRVSIYSSVHLTPEQEKQIDDLFVTHYGQRIPYTWHRHYTAFTGKFDAQYFPELLYIPEFEIYMNTDLRYAHAFEDKNLLKLFAGGVGIRMPETIISCTNGILCDRDYRIIKWNDINNLLPDRICFAKPSTLSSSGQGCMLVDKEQEGILPSLQALGNNFVIQERLICSDSIQKIYPGSVNTFRVMTYFWDGKIHCAPVVMRIGRNGSFLDNAHAGGVFIAVNPDGTLHKTAFTEFKDEFKEHPDTHLVFEGHQIKNFEKVVESAKRMHAAMPQLGVINWDFTIDKDEVPVLIEANIMKGGIWIFQMAWGCGCFGENTIAILEWLKEKNKDLATHHST